MRILFVTATRLGDAVLSTGLLDHLLRTHPAPASRWPVAR
jgi:ADP-heptose:LPS heptosyltransferase